MGAGRGRVRAADGSSGAGTGVEGWRSRALGAGGAAVSRGGVRGLGGGGAAGGGACAVYL